MKHILIVTIMAIGLLPGTNSNAGTTGSIKSYFVPLTSVADVKGMDCPCVNKGTCPPSSVQNCPFLNLPGQVVSGTPCGSNLAGPFDLDTCGTSPNGSTCTDPNNGQSIPCNVDNTGTCQTVIIVFVPVVDCVITNTNVDEGTGAVRDGPSCN